MQKLHDDVTSRRDHCVPAYPRAWVDPQRKRRSSRTGHARWGWSHWNSFHVRNIRNEVFGFWEWGDKMCRRQSNTWHNGPRCKNNKKAKASNSNPDSWHTSTRCTSLPPAWNHRKVCCIFPTPSRQFIHFRYWNWYRRRYPLRNQDEQVGKAFHCFH